MNLSISEQLTYSTVRIECQYADGNLGTGTGFFFRLLDNKETGTHIPVVITNKHVINGAIKGRLLFTKAQENNEPNDREHFNVYFNNFESLWRKHPDPQVDLCAMPIAPSLSEAEKKKRNFFSFHLICHYFLHKGNLTNSLHLKKYL